MGAHLFLVLWSVSIVSITVNFETSIGFDIKAIKAVASIKLNRGFTGMKI